MTGARNVMEKQSANDVVLSVRCDSRALAVMASFYTSEGEFITSNSQLVRMIIEDMRRLTVQHGLEEDILSVEDARNVLEGLGLSNLNVSGRGKKNLFNALQKENWMLEGRDPSKMPRPVTKHLRDRDSQRLDGEIKDALTPEGGEALRKQFVDNAEKRDEKQAKETDNALSGPPTPKPEDATIRPVDDTTVVKSEKEGDEDE